jgi:cyclopropane fatty-acyl-phospholipid synthase-like methyltransferase
VSAPYVTTPEEVIIKMLHIADICPDDILYDLGCGDGRIIITAAKEYGTRGVGIDNDPQRITESRANAKKEGVEHLTTFLQEDVMEADISEATLVTIYMVPVLNRYIKPKLKKQLKPKSRVITREFSMGEWNAITTDIISYNNLIIPIYLYET